MKSDFCLGLGLRLALSSQIRVYLCKFVGNKGFVIVRVNVKNSLCLH